MIFILGYLVAFIGFFIGYIFTLFLVHENITFTTFLLGLTGGLLISFASFELIPVAINDSDVWLVLFFMILTISIIAILDNKYSLENISYGKNNFFKASIILGVGIGMHNLPEGFALGSLYTGDIVTFKSFMLVIMLHCIPESIALCIFLVKSKFKHKNILTIIATLSIPMGLGTYIGHSLYKYFQFVMPISLSVASATMIYVACSEILPTSKNIEKTFCSIIGSIFGILLGITLINIFI